MDGKLGKLLSSFYEGREEIAKKLEDSWKESHYKAISDFLKMNVKVPAEMAEKIKEEFENICSEFDKVTDMANDVSTEPEREESAWDEYYYNEKHFYPWPISILGWMIDDAKSVFPDYDWESLREELNYDKEK